MAEAYKFPDELENEVDDKLDISLESDGEEEITIDIVDDTPKEDRNRKPLDADVKDQLENLDESEDYSKNVKEKFSQYKKAWHEERRAKEAALREQQEALRAAQAILDENKRLQSMLKSGEKELNSNYKSAAKAELEKAKQDYKDAYDSGDADRLLNAQESMVKAQIKLDKAKKFKNTVQNDQNNVKIPVQQYQAPVQTPMDDKLAQWVSRNQWFVNPDKKRMKIYAEAYHEELQNKYGMSFVGTDEYYKRIDNEMKTRFPDELGEAIKNDEEKPQRTSKLSTVVAPAKRSTASKKIVLTKSAQAIAKKLGVTPEQYAREFVKLEV